MKAAVISPCGTFRYVLQRGDGPACAVIGCNPSTADAKTDDNTSRKLGRFAADWGYSAYDLYNVGAARATDPDVWRRMPDPLGPDNDFYLGLAAGYPLIVVAWGKIAPREWAMRAASVLTRYGAELWCLGVNSDGSPKHPLYVSYDTPLRPWRPT